MYYQKFDKNMSFVRLEFEGVLGCELDVFACCCKLDVLT